jgi:hypothetical protein
MIDWKFFRYDNGEIYCLDLFIKQDFRFRSELSKGPDYSKLYAVSATDQEDLNKIEFFLIIANCKGEYSFKIEQKDFCNLRCRIHKWRCSNVNSRYFRIEFIGRLIRQSTLV